MSANPIVVSDATPIIALAKIGCLSLLPALFDEILIPKAVYTEVTVSGRSGAEEIKKAKWIQIKTVVDRTKVNYLLTQLDIGESEALVLAQEMKADWLLVDENKARTIAQRLGLHIIGTAGLLLLAKQEGKIMAVRPLLNKLWSHQFRLSDKVYDSILKKAGER